MSRIKIYDKYASTKQRATADDAHGLNGDTIERLAERFEKFIPKMAGVRANTVTEMDKILPKDASWSPEAFSKRGNVPGGVSMGGNTFHTNQRPYDPAFESPDRQMYPVHRILSNRYSRMFYKLDPVIGTAVDLRSELMWGNFTLSGEGVDGEVKNTLEYMVEETKLRTMLPYLNREYDVVGEVAPHLFFDDAKGIWTHLTLLNPDQLEIIDAPFIRMEPIAEFVPDDRLYEVLTSNNVLLRQVRDTMPAELVSRLMSRQNIPLLPTNFTFIPRKLHPYDVRGTSIISRMWRILMYEDAVFNASIATARRACFVAGTQVMTPSGAKPIEQLRKGDMVIGGSGKPQEVLDAWEEKPSTEGLVNIDVLGTETLRVTPNHKFTVWTPQRNCACGCGEPVGYNGSGYRSAFVSGHHMRLGRTRNVSTGKTIAGASFDWKIYSTEPKIRALSSYDPIKELEAKDIQPGDFMLMPRTFVERPTDIKPEQARLAGYYVAEGSRHLKDNNKLMHWTFSLAEYSTWVSDALSCGHVIGLQMTRHKRLPHEGNHCNRTGRVGASVLSLHKQKDAWFAEWCFANFGVGSANKSFSEEVMSWPLALKEELLRGYYRGDGHLEQTTSSGDCSQVSAASTSRALIYQIRLLLAQLGIFSSISHNPKNTENWNDCWIISSTGRDARALAKLVWGVEIKSAREKHAAAGTEYTGGGARTWSDDKFLYVPVQQVVRTSDVVPTYNISVANDHSYLVSGGICSMNSSPLKVAKLGNPASGWIPDPDNERRLLELLAQAELDPQCFVPETLVTLGDGTHRQIGDIRRGDVVLDRNGQPAEVANVYNEFTHDLVRITLAGGEEFECTPNHAWPVFGSSRVCQCGCNTPIDHGNFAPLHAVGQRNIQYWRHPNAPRKIKDVQYRFLRDFDPNQRLEAKDIRPGDFLKMPRKFKERTTSCSLDQAWLLGLYAAQGNTADVYLREDGTVRLGVEWSLNAAETHLADRIDQILGREVNRFFGHKHNLQVRARTNEDTAIAAWLIKHAGTGARDKSLSVEVMQWPLSYKLAFLEGFVAGDGAAIVARNGRAVIEVCSASLQLIRQVKQIITQLGALASFDERSQPTNSFGTGNVIYRLQVYGELAADLAARAKNKAAIKPKKHKSFFWSDEDYVYARVLKVERLHFSTPRRVVNLSVHGDHSYQVCGVGTYNSWLCYHYGVQFELVGDPGRVMTIDKHWDLIERVKMVAMGISKAFIHGEISYASAATGLTVFLQSLKARRQMFEAQWLMPKFFKPVSVINKWVKPSQAELSHRVRVRRSHRELMEDKRYIMPTLTWDRTLDPSIDAEMIRAMQALQQLGIKFSPSTLMSTVHRDFQEETEQLARDGEHMKKMYAEHPELALSMGAQGPGGGNTVMSPPLPAIPPEQFGEEPPAPAPAAAPEASPQSIWDEDGKYGCWHESDYADLITLMHGEEVESEPWAELARDPHMQHAIGQDDHSGIWNVIENWLAEHDYPARDIIDLEDILKHHGLLRSPTFDDLEKLIDGPLV